VKEDEEADKKVRSELKKRVGGMRRNTSRRCRVHHF